MCDACVHKTFQQQASKKHEHERDKIDNLISSCQKIVSSHAKDIQKKEMDLAEKKQRHKRKTKKWDSQIHKMSK
jgi:hypothetical protein